MESIQQIQNIQRILNEYNKIHGESRDRYAWSEEVYQALCQRLREGYKKEDENERWKWKHYIEHNPPFLIVSDIEHTILKAKYHSLRESIQPRIIALQQQLENSQLYDPNHAIHDIEFLRLFVQHVLEPQVGAKDILAYLQEKRNQDNTRSLIQLAFSCTLM